jgi:hypothetical protein
MRFSLVPYPDVFDLAMYDHRVSGENDFDILMLHHKIKERTVNASTDVKTFGVNEAGQQKDRYHSAAYSCLSGMHSSTSAKLKAWSIATPPVHTILSDHKVGLFCATSPPSSPTVTRSHIASKHSFNTSTAGFEQFCDCDGPLENIDTSATSEEDLSKFEWTEEEFMSIFTT